MNEQTSQPQESESLSTPSVDTSPVGDNDGRQTSIRARWLIIALLLVLALGFVGWLAWRYWLVVPPSNEVPAPNDALAPVGGTNIEPPASVAPINGSEIDTSDWQTYHNDKYGFEFKYPPRLVDVDFSVPSLYERSPSDNPNDYEKTLADLSLIPPDKVVDSSMRVASNATLEFRIQSRTVQEFDKWVKLYRRPTVREVTVGNKKGLQYITTSSPKKTPEIFTVVENGGYLYNFFVGHFGEASLEQINDYHQILSTFRFIE